MTRACEKCGKTDVELVPLVNPLDGVGTIHWICRHGHIDCWTIDPLTGLPMRLTEGDSTKPAWRKTKVLDDSTPMQLEALSLSPKEEILKKLRGRLTE